MLRVKDPAESLDFYCDKAGLSADTRARTVDRRLLSQGAGHTNTQMHTHPHAPRSLAPRSTTPDPSPARPRAPPQLGFTLLHKYEFAQFGFSLYFIAHLPDAVRYECTPGSKEAEAFLWTYPGVTLELTHNHGTEEQEGPAYHNSNDPDSDPAALPGGFGHVAVNTPDVRALCRELEAQVAPALSPSRTLPRLPPSRTRHALVIVRGGPR